MSMAKIFLKAAKAILVGMAATAVGYAGYKTVKESVDAARDVRHVIPRKNVYNFEGVIVDRRTNNGRRVGCEANDKEKAYLTFCKMYNNEFEYCEYESVHVTDFPEDYVKEGKTEFGEEKHYGTAEEYEHDAEYANTPPTKKERRTVFFKQLGISFNDWFLNENLIDTLLFSALGLVSLRLGVLCGRELLKDEITNKIKKSASNYGMKDADPASVKYAGWVNDSIIKNGLIKAGEAIAFGLTTDGRHFVTPASPVDKGEDGRHSIAWKLTI